MKQVFSALTALFLILSSSHSNAYAIGTREAGASLILPTTGQAMNGELGQAKSKIMAGLEFGLVTTAVLLGVSTGGGIVLWAATPLVGNHVWSSYDAYKGAQRKRERENQMKLMGQEPSLEIANPYGNDGVSTRSSDIRTRIQRSAYPS